MIDKPAARELKLYINNDGQLYRQQGEPIIKNLTRKQARGVYNSERAAKLYKYLADNGARKYGEEHMGSGTKGLQTFSPDTRRAVANELRDEFEKESSRGNYMRYIPKYLQKPHPPGCNCPFHGGHPEAKMPLMQNIGRRLPRRGGF